MTSLYLATEDALSEAVGDRIVAETTPALEIAVRMRKNGIGYLKKNLRPRQLIDLVRRYASRPLRAEIVPPEGSRSPMGLGYNQVLGGFVRERWSPMRAARHADSLQRTIRRLRAITV